MEKGNEAIEKTSDKISYMANKSKQHTEEKMDSKTNKIIFFTSLIS
jgi:hypothetical protein